MPPKKAKKIALSEFLGDTTLGSWADEMDALPSAPAPKENAEYPSRRDDFLTSRRKLPDLADRVATIRDEVPLPTQPPYTAFVGNLAFDLMESDLENFFQNTKSVKIIRDRDEKPKGFGYVEFEDLEGLKTALTNNGQVLSGRTVRVSVAEPPKERTFSHGASEDDSKFDNPWRRDGPLPDLPTSRDAPRRKFEGAPERLPSLSESANDWRSQRPLKSSEPEMPKRKASGFLTGESSAADKEGVWAIGSKFKPSANEEGPGGKFGSSRSKSEATPSAADEGDWRSAARSKPTRSNVSPNGSTPPTPQLGRRKLDLLPRSGNVSASPSPLSSPKMGPMPPTSRSNPFGAARPVDVSVREKAITERVDKERDRLSMSRTNSRSGSERPTTRPRTPPVAAPPAASSPRVPPRALAPNVRPTLSFANVAANKENAPGVGTEGQTTGAGEKTGDNI